MIGQRFARWVVLKPAAQPQKNKHYYWLCRCDCGNEHEVAQGSLLRGVSKSCGCWKRDFPTRLRHGHASRNRTPEYRAWSMMLVRCYNPDREGFDAYGGRGIIVCERWRNNYEAFLFDMGRKPSPKHSIDRIDVNGNYEPENCRWATVSQQANNRRTNRILFVDGRQMTMVEASRHYAVPYDTLKTRISRGWPDDKAVMWARKFDYPERI